MDVNEARRQNDEITKQHLEARCLTFGGHCHCALVGKMLVAGDAYVHCNSCDIDIPHPDDLD